ncbi:MAG TPA: four helix bundle suffix domain-containing protein [Chthoniobacterales bacterium]|nr:four helix bundle suffix domain-containing protein [Chthoniobacterales bacterium]
MAVTKSGFDFRKRVIHQTNYLLDQQLRQLAKAFLEEGGLRERMTRARLSARFKPR